MKKETNKPDIFYGRKIYKIPAGTTVFLIALQLNATFDRDVYVSTKNDSQPFGTLQVRFENVLLQSMLAPGQDASGYSDMANGEVSVDFSACEFVKAYEDKFEVGLPHVEIHEREYEEGKRSYLIFDMGNAGDTTVPDGVKTWIGERDTMQAAMSKVSIWFEINGLERVQEIPLQYKDCRRRITYRKKQS